MTVGAARQAAGSGIWIGPDAGELRRTVGPLAWCALESLADRAQPGTDGLTVEASVRSLAGELGVAKNTAHRALTALIRAGVVSSTQTRDGGGRFVAGRYRLHVDGILTLASPPVPNRRASKSASTAAQPDQLTLLTPA